jgi:two-component system, response regulator RegA
MNERTLLLVEDDAALAEGLERALARRGYAVTVCATLHDALERISHGAPDYAAVDLRLPDGSGLAVVRALHEANAHTSVVIVTGYANIATAIEAIKLGAKNYLCKPIDADAVTAALEGARPEAHPLMPATPLSVPRLEWEHIMRVHAEHDNNISATARALGMHRRTLQRKLSRHCDVHPGTAS